MCVWFEKKDLLKELFVNLKTPKYFVCDKTLN